MPETLTQEEAIFHAVLELDRAEQQSAFLEQACVNQPELRRRVEALLHRADAQGPLDRSILNVASGDAVASTTEEGPGTILGPYKLLEQIGEGGMGLVFMAEQSRPVRRKVALKILKPGIDTRQIVARFEAERQALALMDHPNIAKFFDAGTTGEVRSPESEVRSRDAGPRTSDFGLRTQEGRPYFVMELVHGISITEYCDQHRLTPRQRLELFATVCQAVQHAHQKGIIHRDLKPSNVLVTLHDVVPVPKVIDFGIAKATGERLTEKTLFTHFAQMIGTPMYMSPEQAEMNELGVDTRSDVYALGVMLYELLTGATPFDSETLKKVGYDEMRRIIREEEPPRPSHRVSTLEAAVCTTVSARRGMDERRLAPLLRGELDWIVMKALDKDRNRRYESASALAADVQRYLNDEPVEACPPSAGYKVRKFVRRNRRLVGMVGVIVLVLLAATAVSAWQAVLARDAQHQAEAAEQRATSEADIAKAVRDFLQQDLLQQVDTYPLLEDAWMPARNLTVKEALDRAAAKIGQRFQDKPLVEAAIRTSIGEAYRSLGEYQLAIPHLEQAVALRKTHAGADHDDTIYSMFILADTCRYLGMHSYNITLNQQMLESRKALLGPDHPTTLGRVQGLAVAYEYAGELEMSTRLLEQLVKKCRTLFGPTHSSTLSSMHRLAWNYGHMDRFKESIELYEKLLELHRSMASRDQQMPFSSVYFFAHVCIWAKEFDLADRLLREHVEQEQKQKDSLVKPREKANRLALLALNLTLHGRHEQAESFARQAAELSQFDEYQRFYNVSVLGVVLLGQQKYAEAEPLLLQGYEGLKKTEFVHPTVRRWRKQAGEWLVRLYEETEQPEKVRQWREKQKTGGF